MSKLSSKEAQGVIDLMLDSQVDMIVRARDPKLPPQQKKQLRKNAMDLGNEITRMNVVGIIALGLELEESVISEMKQATQHAVDAITKLQDIRKMIRIATALVILAAAVASQNPGAVAKASKGLLDELGVTDKIL